MNKKAKKLRLAVETIRKLNPEALRQADGGYTEYCTVFCTHVTRCVESCPCQQSFSCDVC